MARLLRPTTIIPDALYVKRAADRQLEQIIDDMGRPGYVLVARQMGKTNLLLHMKRRREETGDIVVYVDLSERFESARACFRHIIDIAVETNAAFAVVARRIQADREASNSEAALEFGRHVRLLINALPEGKIIIILDEVDSLINSLYGDTILAQVRSTYFARTNFSEFERLTYVLSGVAEPTDLIKDKNISPFNIGEKIYLTDFSKEESAEFFERASLGVRKSVMDSVYGWCAGNPRMTWDVCSAIELALEEGSAVTPQTVEAIVRQIFLTDFDKPPIDHIRSLVASDNQLKNALVSIRYGKGSTIDAKTKSRLYLAGVTTTPAADQQIKNRIIDLALSDAWLAQTSESSASAVTLAAEHFAGKRYKLVAEALRSVEDGLSLTPLSRVQLGISLYNIDDFEGAATELQSVLPEVSGETRTTTLYYLGAALLFQDLVDESLLVLEDAAENGTGGLVLPAKLLLASAYYRSAAPDSRPKSMELGAQLVSEVNRVSDHDRRSRDVLASSLYSLALSAANFGDADAMQKYFGLALTLAPAEMQPAIAISAAAYREGQAEKIEAATLAADAVLSHSLRFSPDGEVTLAFRERTLAALLLLLFECDLSERTEQILDYSVGLYRNPETHASILIKLAQLLADGVSNQALPLLRYVEDMSDVAELPVKLQLSLRRMLSSQAPEAEQFEHQKVYFSIVEALDDPEQLSQEDAFFMVLVVQTFATSGRNEQALQWADIAAPSMIATGHYNWASFVLYYKTMIYRSTRDLERAKETARQLVDFESKLDLEEIRESGIQNVIASVFSQAKSVLSERDPAAPDPYRGIGRNQKIVITEIDGTRERTVKFKAVETHLRSGSLLLVRILPR